MNLNALKMLDSLLPFEEESYRAFLRAHLDGMTDQGEMEETIVNEIKMTVFSGIDLKQLLETSILVASQNIQNDIEYDKLATRLLLINSYREVFSDLDDEENWEDLYRKNFRTYIHKGIDTKLLDPKMAGLFDLDELAAELVIERDDIFKFIGLSTALQRYVLRDRDQIEMETPQYMWMRIAMGLSLNETNPTEQAKIFYDKLSKIEYIPGGSTNIGAGTTFPVLSNCYLIDTEDDIHSIFDNVKNVALISKATGGIGISVTKLRAAGSPVKSNNTMSTGPIPFIKVMDSALKSMSRAGKKYGAMCVYMENWHVNFPEFLDLKQNAGDDYRRIRTADTAVYISDEFMKRVINNEKWYMFDPAETPDLPELYGSEFSRKYKEYCEKADRGQMNLYKVVPAREQMKQILTSLQSTSHPWLTWKDTINLRALNNNTGTIHCSNLCTEICLPQDRENIAVCNLAYINLANHVNLEGVNEDDRIDWHRLEDTVRVLMRHLDNLVEVNASPLKETKNSDDNNRAVGMGMSGLAEVLEHLGYAYDSNEAYDFMDRVTEFVSYISIDESCNLAEERGVYPNFEGSMWSKGYVPIDTVERVAKDRIAGDTNGHKVKTINNSTKTTILTNTLDKLKNRIHSGVKNATLEETRELYEIFDQLADLISTQKEQNNVDGTGQSHLQEDLNRPGEGISLTQNESYRMDWDRLRERVKEGVRNATTMAIAPNASTGLVAGTSPGVDPRFAQIFSRNTYSGKFLDINHNLVIDLKKLGIWEKVKTKVLENYGDISNINEIPDNLKAVYKTSFQISPYAYIEIASRAQKWIDQSISRNMYLETRDVDEMVEIYTDAWRRGLKTTYYLHVKPRHSAEQSTVRVNKAEKINKKGFSELMSAKQPTLDNSKEVKGFGFVQVPKKEEVEEEVQVTTNLGMSNSDRNTLQSETSFGFSKVKQKVAEPAVVEQKAFKEDKPMKQKTPNIVIGANCPLDPAERANCEACQ